MNATALRMGLAAKTDKDIKAWARAMPIAFGISVDDAMAALQAEKDKLAKADKDTKLTKAMFKLTVPAKVAKLAKDNPDLTIVVKVEGDKVVFAIGSKRKSSKKTGSAMSARSAVDYGNKKGDNIDFSLIEKTAKEIQGLSQRGVLFRDYNASEAVAKLRQFGYTS